MNKYYKIKWFLYDIKESIKWFFKNIYIYRTELTKIRPWQPDFHFLKRHLELLYKNKLNDCEIDESKFKKCEKIKRAIYLLECLIEDDYYLLAEKELNVKYTYSKSLYEDFVKLENEDLFEYKPNLTEKEKLINKQISLKSREIYKSQWIELFEILKGQEYDDNFNSDKFDDLYDGSNYERWWS